MSRNTGWVQDRHVILRASKVVYFYSGWVHVVQRNVVLLFFFPYIYMFNSYQHTLVQCTYAHGGGA